MIHFLLKQGYALRQTESENNSVQSQHSKAKQNLAVQSRANTGPFGTLKVEPGV
jgi:ribosomal protein L9